MMHKFARKTPAKAKAAVAAAKELYPFQYVGVWAKGTWVTQSGDYVFFEQGGRFIASIGRKWCRVEEGPEGDYGKVRPTDDGLNDGYFEITVW